MWTVHCKYYIQKIKNQQKRICENIWRTILYYTNIWYFSHYIFLHVSFSFATSCEMKKKPVNNLHIQILRRNIIHLNLIAFAYKTSRNKNMLTHSISYKNVCFLPRVHSSFIYNIHDTSRFHYWVISFILFRVNSCEKMVGWWSVMHSMLCRQTCENLVHINVSVKAYHINSLYTK